MTFSDSDIPALAALLRQAGEEEIMLRFAGIGDAEIKQKQAPWDVVTEAGGYTVCLDGAPYRPGITDGGLITTTDPESWRLIRREIFGM